MRWQKIARLAIAAFVIVFAAVVVVALRRPAPSRAPEHTPREDLGTIAETRRPPGAEAPVYTSTTPDGKVRYRIAYDKLAAYADGRNVFTNGTITLPDRNGRSVDITGGTIEALVPQNHAGPLDTVTITQGVKLLTSDGLEVTSDQATYHERTGVVSVPGAVQFKKERLTGSGVGATYDRDRDVLMLLSDARMNIAPDASGRGAADASAGSAALARSEHSVRLTTAAHVVSEGRTLDADDITIQLSADDRFIRGAALRGNSRITGGPAGSAEGMSARDIDLIYGPDGGPLQQARLVENAVASLAGSGPNTARRVSGRTIDITMGPDGATVTALTASQNVQVDIPAEGATPARRINAAHLNAGGASGLEQATFTGGVTYRELRAAAQDRAAERTGTSESLVVETQPNFGAISQADFVGNVRIVDGATTAEGQRAIYDVADDRFDLVPLPGRPGPPPSVNDGRVLVNAGKISLTIVTRKLTAEGSVRSSLQPSSTSSMAPGKDRKPGNGRIPSMLKAGEVVNVASNRLEYDGAAEQAVYTGEARLWQDKTTVKGDTIVVDDRSGNLTATGRVQTVMFFEELDSATKTKKLVQMDAAADKMVYEESTRVATYTTGPTGKAHIVGTQGDVVADRIQLFLEQDVNELERAEADGNVVVKEGGRTAKGNHLTYTTADDTYVMDGSPVEIEERTPTDCRITEGSRLTFKRAVVSTTIQNNGLIPNHARSCAPK